MECENNLETFKFANESNLIQDLIGHADDIIMSEKFSEMDLRGFQRLLNFLTLFLFKITL